MIWLLIWGALGWWLALAIFVGHRPWDVRYVLAHAWYELLWRRRPVRDHDGTPALVLCIDYLEVIPIATLWSMWRQRCGVRLRDLIAVDVRIMAVGNVPNEGIQGYTAKLACYESTAPWWHRHFGSVDEWVAGNALDA